MLNVKRRGCYINLNITKTNKLKTVKLFIWVKPTRKVKTSRQLIKIYKINSRKPMSLKLARKVTTSESGFWLKIESKRVKRFLNHLLSNSSDQNVKVGLLANNNIFKVIVTNKRDTKVSWAKIFTIFFIRNIERIIFFVSAKCTRRF